MSRPTAISPEEQEQIARRIGVLLLRSAAEDWQQIMVEYRATGDYHDLLGEVVDQNGAREPWQPPEELVGIFEHLREGMYRPDVGTWLSALYVVERPSSYRIDINFDTEPQWSRSLPRAAYIDEFRRYPRAEENIPDWVQAKLEGSSGPVRGPAEATMPSGPPEPGPAPIPQRPAMQNPVEQAPDRAAVNHSETAPGLRRVLVFDGNDEQGRPVVTTRKPVPQEELMPLRHYLENAPIVVPSQDADSDRLNPQSTASVPTSWRTDGTWLWQDAVAFYLAQYGVPPQNEFVDHIRAARFTLPEVDDRTWEAARRELLGDAAAIEEPPAMHQPAAPAAPVLDTPPPDRPVMDSPAPFSPETAAMPADPEPAGPAADAEPAAVVAPDEGDDSADFDASDNSDAAPDSDADHVNSDPAPDDPAPDYPSSDHPVSDHLAAGADSSPATGSFDEPEQDEAEVVDEDAETVLSLLRKKLSAHEVDEDSVGIAERIPQVRSLVREGSGWLVTAGSDELPSGDVRFARIDQAAAYLLGSVLLYRTAPERLTIPSAAESPAPPPAPPVPQAPPAAPAVPEPPPETELVSKEPQPPENRPEPAGGGGNFLFTANQGQPSMETRVPPPRQDTTDRAGQRENPPERQAPSEPEPTQYQPMPRMDRPAPPSPPTGQPAQPLPPGIQGPTPGQTPPPLPKRQPRMDQNTMGRPPERPGAGDRLAGPPQQGAGGPGPAGGAERRPGPGGPAPAGPPRQGPMPGALQRPPQPPPGSGPMAPGAGREQQIQPLQGEPPLTLYRDRRPTTLPPGTELDRFGDPNGNVTYAVHTPYSKRSLPPQWAGRPYVAYRVQRPLPALQGTAVPWFEQPGGGTAYVLPAAINDLLADGVLVELGGNDAPPRPPME